jgi:hypothetical protein
MHSIRTLTVVVGSSESVSQTCSTNGSDKGVETVAGGDFDNVLTSRKGSGTQEGSCYGFDELHIARIQLKQQNCYFMISRRYGYMDLSLKTWRKDETPTCITKIGCRTGTVGYYLIGGEASYSSKFSHIFLLL